MISFEMGKKAKLKVFFFFFLKNFLHCVFVTFESLLPLEACLRKRRVWAPQTHTHRTQETLFLFGSTFPLKTPLYDTKQVRGNSLGVTAQNWLYLNGRFLIKVLITPTHPDVMLRFPNQ